MTGVPVETLAVVAPVVGAREPRPLTATVTVSMLPAPLGPSICVVDSLRKSEDEAWCCGCGCMLDVGVERRGEEPSLLSHGIGVSVAPLRVSSCCSSSGSDTPLRRPWFGDAAEFVASGKADSGDETETIRSRARR